MCLNNLSNYRKCMKTNFKKNKDDSIESDGKWNKYCEVCEAKKELSLKISR